MLFLEKKNGSIVCVGNWAQALHFIEQQISTCTVVATSVPSSLSPDQSVLHPVLSLAYQCSKKCPLLVVFKSNQDPNWGFFDLSNLPVGETLQKCPSPQGGNICSAQKLAQEKAWEFALMFCPSYFLFFWGKEGNTCVMTQTLELLCAMRCPPNAAVLLGTGDGVEFFFPHSLLQKVWVTRCHTISARGARGRGYAEEQDVLILVRSLFIVSMIGLNEEGRNWPGWQSRLIRHFLSAPYPSKTSG